MSVHCTAQHEGQPKNYVKNAVIENGIFLGSLIHPRVVSCDAHSYQFQSAFSDAYCSF